MKTAVTIHYNKYLEVINLISIEMINKFQDSEYVHFLAMQIHESNMTTNVNTCLINCGCKSPRKNLYPSYLFVSTHTLFILYRR